MLARRRLYQSRSHSTTVRSLLSTMSAISKAVMPLLDISTAWALRRNSTIGEVLAYTRSITFSSLVMFVLVTLAAYQEGRVLFFGGYNYREAFDDFDATKIAKYSEAK